jgi:hypothetical protein
MKLITFLLCLAIAAVAAYVAARADDADTMPADERIEVNGYALACTGVGDEARNDPRWREFSLRIEFANRDAQYLSDIDVKLSDAGGELFAVRCESPWLLADMPPGKYTVTGTFEGIAKTVKVSAPATGQARIVIRFPEVAGDQ